MKNMKLISEIEKAFVKLRRKRVSRNIFDLFDGKIQNGIFKDLQLTPDTNTSEGVLGSKILGFYENVVSEFVIKNGPYENVINLGSADGYFPIGMLIKNIASRAICFEITEVGRKSIEKNARANNCEDSIKIFGKADRKFYKKIQSEINSAEKNLIICDIEGGEFEFITRESFNDLKNCIWVIELHDKIQDKPKEIREKFLEIIPEGFSYNIIKSNPIIWPQMELLENLSDNDRVLLFSEGRKKIGEWLTVIPPAIDR